MAVEDAFILHIDGAWGSGKSSLLLLIRKALEEAAQKEKSQKGPRYSIREALVKWSQESSLLAIVREALRLKAQKKPQESSLLAIVREALRLKAQKKPQDSSQHSVNCSLRDVLKKFRRVKSTQWIIVEFNAWQNQRTGPPWWSLMDTVYTQARKAIAKKTKLRSFKLSLWENQWRLRTKHSNILLAMSVTFAIIGFLILAGVIELPSIITNEATSSLVNATQTQAENPIGEDLGYFVNFKFTGIIAFIVAAFSFFGMVKTSLVPGSSQAAKEFMELSNDPMNRIKYHFSKLISKIEDPVIIFIDDLDRCRDDYTVEFLEGIQTLFRKVNIIYVIAADKRWIYSSYEKSYEVFKAYLDEPGFPFGYLFLQKIFQLSVFMPSPSQVLKDGYWNYLISSAPDKSYEEMAKAEKDAEEKISSTNESEWLDEIKHGNPDPIYQQRLRDKAIEKLATPEVQIQIEHMLKPYTPLLDPNPRSMKRFVNMYQIVRATDLLRGGTIEREKLALWTILWYRWPDLAQCVKENPELVEYINEIGQEIQDDKDIPDKLKKEIQDDKDIPDKLKKLFWNQEVIDVIGGNGVESRLEANDIRDIVGLYGL